ncbi:MAG TPA: hypothetical protein IAC25_04715 [Candidatus Enterenecus stercoripullorum]|nr:hypothetical protein [Candidatus Enterenecus stercoripullorum]
MKANHFTVLAAAILAAALLTGCSADQNGEAHTQDVRPSGTLRVSDDPEPSVSNDAMEGGGAGGTNDTDNDGQPDASPDHSGRVSGDGPLEDIGDAAGDLIEGAGDAVKDAGDAVGKAADRAGNAMK